MSSSLSDPRTSSPLATSDPLREPPPAAAAPTTLTASPEPQSTPTSGSIPEASSPASNARIPSLRAASDSASPSMTVSSTPLGSINAARRPPGPPSSAAAGTVRPGGLPVDMAEKLKAFHLSRRGTPSSPAPIPHGGDPPLGSPGPGGVPASFAPPGAAAPTTSRPPGFSTRSAPMVPRAGPKPLGGLAAKRGLQGGMNLTNAMRGGPPGPLPATGSAAPGSAAPPSGEAAARPAAPETAFSKYSQYIDTAAGTLKFQGKATIHGAGIDFSGGSSFSISLDEVDTLDELGEGNYGTVYQVRHSRPRVRRRGLGLAGNKAPASLNASPVDAPAGAGAAVADGTTGLVMAMKEIRLELDDAKFAAIIMELDVLHRCVSPFIVDFYGAFFQEGAVYICMEFMDGGSVDKLYGDGVPEPVLRRIALSTVAGLRALKDDHHIIHRDVKPTNILVNSRGQVKICDFGVSGNLVASIAKTNIGCQSYMAPERIAGGGVAQAGANPGGGTYSVQSDVWSLGLTVVECAMGRYPYPPETYSNIFSQLSAIVEGDPPSLPAEGFSPAAHDFVAKCLHKVPKSRPTYAMLLRHPWLAPLLQPPSIAEDAEAAAAALPDSGQGFVSADEEVAAWVRGAIEKRRLGKLKGALKPALHAAPLDAVPSPTPDRGDGGGSGAAA